jgi:hypothetical protein
MRRDGLANTIPAAERAVSAPSMGGWTWPYLMGGDGDGDELRTEIAWRAHALLTLTAKETRC